MSNYNIMGNCRLREEYVEDGLPPRLAWELAKCQARPRYKAEDMQQPDARYGEETRRRVRRMYDVRSTMYDVERERACGAGKWMRAGRLTHAAAMAAIVVGCAAFWAATAWAVWVFFSHK